MMREYFGPTLDYLRLLEMPGNSSQIMLGCHLETGVDNLHF
jgi:hypothetical protein